MYVFTARDGSAISGQVHGGSLFVDNMNGEQPALLSAGHADIVASVAIEIGLTQRDSQLTNRAAVMVFIRCGICQIII